MVIETEHLDLRAWQESDTEPFIEMNSNEEVMRYFVKPYSKEESEAMLTRIKDHFTQHGYGFFAVEHRDSEQFMGFVGLNNVHYETPFTPCVEIGWRLLPQFWGKGYATEAASALLDFGFQYLKLKEIVAFTTESNLASRKVMEKIGMTRDLDGDFDHPLVPKDHPLIRHVLYRKKGNKKLN